MSNKEIPSYNEALAIDEESDQYYEKLSKEELIQVVKVIESDLFKCWAENMRMKT